MARSGVGAEQPRKFPLVGVGASAGGLAAFEAFFTALPPPDTLVASFVVVQHLDPEHTSLLAELLRPHTSWPVEEIADGTPARPGVIHVLTQGHDLEVRRGRLRWTPAPVPRGNHLPIDSFFRSLARDAGPRAVAIVLSGTGSDGAQGVRAVKAAGGTVLVQSPLSADYADMPTSSLATGLADGEGTPAELALRLATLLLAEAADPDLSPVFLLLNRHKGHDFSQYKPRTLHRRIERRMALVRISSLAIYIELLERDPQEVDALFQDLLIGVTQFFRDASAFRFLEESIIPLLLAENFEGAPIRIWSAGCSTGEEAYSLAILFEERLEALGRKERLQVFATDLDSRAIAVARAGRYAADIAADVLPARLSRYFDWDPRSKTYTVRKFIRDRIVFSEQDLGRDPPFSRIDFLACRNLLIYLGSELQSKLLALFHYSLLPGGVLFLGNAETVGEATNLFTPLDRQVKVFRRSAGPEPWAARDSGRVEMARIPPLLAPGTSPEELQAFNEELQSTNEELETSKEELQSVNEELSTVNAELQAKVAELAMANDDMNNLLAGTGIATVFVDQGLRIVRFTPEATRIIPLLPGDLGRPLANLVTRLVGYTRLLPDAQSVLDTLRHCEHDVATDEGNWYTLRLQPYRTLEGIVQGVVISFVDITEIVAKREALKKANDQLRLAVVVRDSGDAVTVQDLAGLTLAWNPAAERLYGWSEAEALGLQAQERIPDELKEQATSEVQRLSLAPSLETVRTRRKTKDGRVLEVSLTSSGLYDAAGSLYAIATTERIAGAP